MNIMDFAGVGSVAVITVLCYLIALGVKQTRLDSKWLPTICGALGAVLGVVGMYVMPEYPAGDILTAIAVGIVSGLAATGADQVGKQLAKSNDKA